MGQPGLQPRWIDNHCHLDGDEDPAGVVSEAGAAGVDALVCVGVTVERSRACVRLAESFERVWATAGVHPHEAAGGLEGLEELLRRGKEAGSVVAVGECGLDHHYDHSPREVQRDVFAAQIALAHDQGLALVIHTREAWEETFDLLDAEGVPERTVFHCFTGGVDEAHEALSRSALLSVSGIVTFGGADELRRAVAETPLSSLMLETDSPYLAPVPHRGKRNRPAWVAHVGEKVAELHGVPTEQVAAATSGNARQFYGLELPGDP
jgi:TatD DNase family protein